MHNNKFINIITKTLFVIVLFMITSAFINVNAAYDKNGAGTGICRSGYSGPNANGNCWKKMYYSDSIAKKMNDNLNSTFDTSKLSINNCPIEYPSWDNIKGCYYMDYKKPYTATTCAQMKNKLQCNGFKQGEESCVWSGGKCVTESVAQKNKNLGKSTSNSSNNNSGSSSGSSSSSSSGSSSSSSSGSLPAEITKASIENFTTSGKNNPFSRSNNAKEVNSCEDLLGSELIEKLKEIFIGLRIAAPILTVVLVSKDIVVAVGAGKEDDMKKAQKNMIKRLIILVAIMFLPTIVNVVLSLIASSGGDLYTTCGIG